ncbi:MAG: chorismate lyase [Pseudomonadales bacterium]|nr:chorismate lyase [Pseudomonadales bacterium]
MSSFAPQSQLHNLLKTFNFQGIPRFKVPREYRTWLFDPGSLTKKLVLASNGDFRVEVLRQYHGPITVEEQLALASEARCLPFIREVQLICNGEPWVFARTVIPRVTEAGPGRYLTRLGTKPLGVALFNDPNISRGAIHVKRIKGHHLQLENVPGSTDIWGRHSSFYLHNKPLLVSEYFLPNCPMYANSDP